MTCPTWQSWIDGRHAGRVRGHHDAKRRSRTPARGASGPCGVAALMLLALGLPLLPPAAASAFAGSAAATARLHHAAADDVEDVLPRLEREDFAGALNAASLGRGERDLLMAFYEDYRATLEQLAAEQDARRVAAGRDRYDDAIAGRLRLTPDELAGLRREIALADLDTWRPASLALADLLELCQFSLEAGSAERLAAELPGLRRHAYLSAIAAGDDPRLEAGESVDLERLLMAASREELADVPGGSLETVLAGWSAAIDSILPATAGEIRAARIERRVARGEGDLAGMEDADERLVAAWARLHAPQTAAADRIARLAREAGGESAVAAWRDRVRRAAFPWLYEGARRPVLAAEWVARNVGGDPAAEARAIADRWVGDRGACDAETAALILEARRDHRRIVHPRSSPALLGGGRPEEIFRELLRVSGRAEQIDREAEEAIADLLEPSDRGRMRSDLRALMMRRR